jgi:hypothetical protein
MYECIYLCMYICMSVTITGVISPYRYSLFGTDVFCDEVGPHFMPDESLKLAQQNVPHLFENTMVQAYD